MNPLVRDKLCQILATYGTALYLEPRRCENLLNDLCPQDKREVHVLVGALREHVPADLASPTVRKGTVAAIGRLTKRLEDNLALAAAPARWAVETWAVALGVVTAQQLAAAATKLQRKPVQPSPVTPPPVIIARRRPSVRGRAIALTVCLVLAGSGVGLALAWNRSAPPQPLSRPAQPIMLAQTPAPIADPPPLPAIEVAAVVPAAAPAAPSIQTTTETSPPITDEEVAIARGALFPTLPKISANE